MNLYVFHALDDDPFGALSVTPTRDYHKGMGHQNG
jgi:hypothetical protein